MHVTLDRNPGPGYDTLLLRIIPGDLFSAFPHRQFHTLPGLLDIRAALPNSYPNACMPIQGGSLYHFYDGLCYDPAERRTHDLPCERRTRYRLSQSKFVIREVKISRRQREHPAKKQISRRACCRIPATATYAFHLHFYCIFVFEKKKYTQCELKLNDMHHNIYL